MKWTDVTAGYEPICDPIADHMPNRSIEPEGITISCYENDVPAFIEADMNRIYGNLYSSLAQIRAYGNVRDMSTYIVRKGDRTITVFLFQHHGGNVRVINQVIKIDEEDISRFAAYIFANFVSATVISFDYIQTNLRTLPFPFQRVNLLENIVLSLPDTAEEYFVSLGKHMRRKIKVYTKKVQEAFSTIRFEMLVRDEIDEQIIRDIIDLNRARMANKNKVSAIDEEETERIIRLATECGLVGVARIDGRVCAGGILFCVGSNYFLTINAHDPMYDDYRLGTLCCYLTICECIAREGKEFHFLWGDYKFKYSLLGVKHDLDKVVIYRSLMQMLFNGDMVLNTAFRGYLRQMILWLHKAKRWDNFRSHLAITLLNRLRYLKQCIQGISAKRK